MRCPDCGAPLFECDFGAYCSRCSWDSFTETQKPKKRRLPIFRLVRKPRHKKKQNHLEAV
jgi:uncharacterized Zn finger protein (UPF0148 family)